MNKEIKYDKKHEDVISIKSSNGLYALQFQNDIEADQCLQYLKDFEDSLAKVNEGKSDRLCEMLSKSISEGNREESTRLLNRLIDEKVQVEIAPLIEDSQDELVKVIVRVEEKRIHDMKISYTLDLLPTMTIRQLKHMVRSAL